MELRNYLRILRRYWVSVLAVTLGGVATAGLASLLAPPVYSSSASVIFSVPTGASPGELNAGANYMTTQVRSYMQIARAPLVLNPVIRRLALQESATELAARITASNPASTAILDLEVTGADPQQISAIADEVAGELITAANQLAPKGADGTPAITATIVAPASVPSGPLSPRLTRNIAIGAMIGALLALGQAALRSRSDIPRFRGDIASPDSAELSGRRLESLSGYPDTEDRIDDEPPAETYRQSLAELQRSVDAILARLG